MTPEEKRLLEKYFPSLTSLQWQQLEALPTLYREWNVKINVVSRKDIDNLVPHHILHSMSIGLFTRFAAGTKIFDIGTGGGLPGIPLAILFPECDFLLIDSIGKKVRVAEAIGNAIGLTNVRYQHIRAEDVTEQCHFIVSRAALKARDLVGIGYKLVNRKEQLNALPNGIIALKGGNLTEELQPFRRIASVEGLTTYLPDEPFYEEKKVVYIPI